VISPGVYPTLPEAEYRADLALGSTDLKNMLRAPSKFMYERTHQRPRKAEFELGTAGHSVLFGGRPPEIVQYRPADAAPTDEPVPAQDWKSARARKVRDEMNAAGKLALTAPEYDAVQRYLDALLSHPDAADLVSGHPREAEVSAFAVIEGVPCKARLDRWHRVQRTTVDVKFLADAHPRHVNGLVGGNGYGLQGGAYHDVLTECGAEVTEHVLVCVEKEPPHPVSVIRLSARALERGKELASIARQRWRDCTEAGVWPDYLTGIATVDGPDWWHRSLDEWEVI
jgi:hypothetical protein